MKAKTNKHEEYIKAHAAAIPQLEAAIQQLKVARLDVSTESIADIVLSDSKAIRTQAKRLAAEADQDRNDTGGAHGASK